ncbi:MAG: NUDIX domain-containing protein [Chloroflexota bacterium]|jgi:ADP-ribose pyrophosphatase YjhB (NUDIX family)|nr:NUDIX domain-containing protein [Chloroflexota bacterium]
MPPPTDDARQLEDQFWRGVASRNAIRVSVRALVVLDDHILVQRLNHSDSVRWFPGGELEFGEPMEAGLRREIAEESTLDVKTITYRFVFNNRFDREGEQFHFLEHYFEVTPSSRALDTLEDHFDHEWISVEQAASFDIRPAGVRDILSIPSWRNIRVLEVS